jgi:hypothetical protein
MWFKRFVIINPTLLSLFPAVAAALVVEIQGVTMEPERDYGSNCVNIEGEYEGLRIESSDPAKLPQVCFNSEKVNTISIRHATFVAVPPSKREVVISFSHVFPPGPNGKIMARARLHGFFSTANGTGVAIGDKVRLNAFFRQNNSDDAIADPIEHEVADQIDSAMFDHAVKEQYLISGERILRGELKFTFADAGHKLTLTDNSKVSIDTGSTFADKLDTLETTEEMLEAEEGTQPEGTMPEVMPVPGASGPSPGVPDAPPLSGESPPEKSRAPRSTTPVDPETPAMAPRAP